MKNKKHHYRLTADDLAVANEIEKMAKIASEKEKHFVMLGDDDLRTGTKNPLTPKEQTMSFQSQMDTLIDAELARLPKGTGRHIAVQNVCRANPDLRQAAVKEHNDDLQNNKHVVDTAQRHSNRSYGSR